MKTSDCAETLCGHIRQVKKAEVTKFIAEVQADVCREGHPCGKPSLCLECKAVGCISAAGDVVNIEGTQSCIARHMKASGHTLSLYLPTGQISCSVCNVDSFRSMIIGYTGTDNAGLAKLNTFNEYIVKCWNERQASSKQLSKEQQEKLFGLVNFKNTCYFNSVLQCLYSTSLEGVYKTLPLQTNSQVKYRPIHQDIEYFYDEMLEKVGQEEWHIVSSSKRSKSSNTRPIRATKVVDFQINQQFQRFVHEASKSGGKSVSPLKLFQCLGYIEPTFKDPTKQNDAQECMRVLLDAMSEGELLFLDINLERYRKVEKCLGPQKLSIIDRMFGMYLASRVVCLKCEKVSWTVDLALDLEVEISQATKNNPSELLNLKSEGSVNRSALRYPFPVNYPESCSSASLLFDHFFREEKLSKANYYSCDSCKSSNALKRFYLLEPGEILTVVIKRFKGLNKDCTHLPFEELIDIGAVTLSPSQEAASEPARRKYKLLSVIVHEGGSASQGHYICCTCIDDCWIVFNDEKVTATNWDRVKKMQAYILIYKAI